MLLHASSALLSAATAVIIVLAGCMVVTQVLKWKISLHASGMAGAVTVLVFIFGPLYALLGVLILVIGWARWQVRAHTPLQTLGGTLLAIVITVSTFLLFGLGVR